MITDHYCQCFLANPSDTETSAATAVAQNGGEVLKKCSILYYGVIDYLPICRGTFPSVAWKKVSMMSMVLGKLDPLLS